MYYPRLIVLLGLGALGAACQQEHADEDCESVTNAQRCADLGCKSKNADFYELDSAGACLPDPVQSRRACVRAEDRVEYQAVTYYARLDETGQRIEAVMSLDSDVGKVQGWVKCESLGPNDCGCNE